MAKTTLGIEGKLYRNTGSWASPVWNEIPNVKDLSLGLEKGEADASSRFTKWKLTRGAMKEATIEWGMIRDSTDADWLALHTAWLADTVVGFAVADGPIATAGTMYFKVECEILKFSHTENMEEVMITEVSIKPARTDNAPDWITVPS